MTATTSPPAAKRQSLEEYLADKARVRAEYAARGEDSPDKTAWFRRGIARRRAEFGWIVEEETA